MAKLKAWARMLAIEEDGHATALPAYLLGIAAAVLLAWGINEDEDGLVIAGAAALGTGMIAAVFAAHYWFIGVLARLDKLEKK